MKQFADGTHPYSTDMRPDSGNRPPAEPPATPLLLGRHIALTTCGECHGWDLTGFAGDETPSLILVNKAYSPESSRG